MVSGVKFITCLAFVGKHQVIYGVKLSTYDTYFEVLRSVEYKSFPLSEAPQIAQFKGSVSVLVGCTVNDPSFTS
jgi:hypothetical protein